MTSSFLLQYFAKEHIHASQAVVCGSNAIGARFRNFRSTGDIDLVLSFWEFSYLWLLCGWKIELPLRRTFMERDPTLSWKM